MTYGFIGTGNMGGALARAAAKAVEVRSSIVLANRTPEKAARLADEIGASVADNLTVARGCDYILLGVKPQMMADMLVEIAPALKERTTPFVLLSMAAGLTVQRIREMAGGDYPVIRIMPNTAVAVGEGVTMYCCSDNVTEAQREGFVSLLHCSGLLEELDEKLMDVGSAVAGCGRRCWRVWRTARCMPVCPAPRRSATPPRCCWAWLSWRWPPMNTPGH